MRSLVPALLVLLAAPPLRAQQAAAPRSRLGAAIGVASPGTWLDDGSGTTVRSRIAPTLALEARALRPAGVEYLLGLRASGAQTVVDATISERDGSAIWVVDLFAGGGRRVLRERGAWRAGVVGAFVGGGGDVAPFAQASRFAPGAELGAAVRVTDRRPLWLALGAQALRYGSGGDAPTTAEAGTVYRILLELRHDY
jgi:hypothetical protein